jgi:dephospho-CoA kinase|tara:strand:+ start:140 stop:727 length:588 start_codon:yes stop_codon:yes gene_type:complete
MRNIGLTGGIGSGKSTVSKMLLSRNIPVYDSDSKAKILMNSSEEIREKIIKYFGNDSYVNNELNKKYISNIIFNNKSEIKKINSLVHPIVYKDFENWKKNIVSNYIIFESALIFETGFYKKNDFNILVVSDLENRIKRVMIRDGLKENDVLMRIKNQWSDEKKIPLSDYVIINNSMEKTKKQVLKMIIQINKKFK